MHRFLWILFPLIAATYEVDSSARHIVAHEWGTFTSIADKDGHAVEWNSIAGPDDLPCFVRRLPSPWTKSSFLSRVRMETPVIYFYSPREATVSVKVDFPRGLLTEWYPHADDYGPNTAGPGRLQWGHVRITPGAGDRFLQEPGSSHYYAARDADADPIEVRKQGETEWEKFIFYRGVGWFAPPIVSLCKLSGVELCALFGVSPR
ncbi:MAG TPA: hypothetical protein VM120_25580 [Bryobacteraceae bacterium]|nr:hypothetical protein [Bryobacteraceae bacterium]